MNEHSSSGGALSALVRRQAAAVARLAATNPFTDAWTRAEADALGGASKPRERPWSLGADTVARTENVRALEALTRDLVARFARVLKAGTGTDADAALYRELVLFDLYNRAVEPLDELVHAGGLRKVPAWRALHAAFNDAFVVDPRAHPGFAAAHWFAGCFQLRRAFFHTFRFIVGTSSATARLRAAIWESIFTTDAGRYRRSLVERMKDVPTLVLGETGTGKELVARAIGLSGFVPFVEEKLTFAGDPEVGFLPMHLQALSPTLVESALFGHKKGAFTGALEERVGVFGACPPWGTVFLDEVGDLDPALQTKLLRVLETRDFAPLGQNEGARFRGRVIAATHRDLAADVERGAFRRDLYFRLAGLVVRTPTLRARIDDDATELARLVAFLADQVAGPEEGPGLARDVERALLALPKGYPWTGNVRELAQHVRAVLVHGGLDTPAAAAGSWLDEARAGTLSADALVTHYVRHVHAQVGTFDGTARQLGLDRRTVKARVEGDRGGR